MIRSSLGLAKSSKAILCSFQSNSMVYQPNIISEHTTKFLNVRCYSNQKPKGFLSGIIDNFKEEYSKNKELKDSVQKFREEAKKLEQSDALKDARNKYKVLETETDKSSKIIKETFENITEKVKDSELGKKAAEFTGELSKSAQKAADSVVKQTQDLSQTNAFKKVSENIKVIQQNIDEATQLSQVNPFLKPKKLRKRSEIDETQSTNVYQSNDTATGMVLHKDSKLYQSWQNFKDNNPYVNKLFELKSQYDESDNQLIRVTRVLQEKISSVFGGIFKSNEMSEVLTEIVKSEPTFELNDFLKRCQYDIIPNILESLSQNEFDILKDWCTETAFNILTQPITQCQNLKMVYHNQVLDIRNVEIAASKIMEQGPVLIVTFQAQQIVYVTNSDGKVIEGEKDKIKIVHHVWALCRDQADLNPDSAWRLMECAMHQSDMFV